MIGKGGGDNSPRGRHEEQGPQREKKCLGRQRNNVSGLAITVILMAKIAVGSFSEVESRCCRACHGEGWETRRRRRWRIGALAGSELNATRFGINVLIRRGHYGGRSLPRRENERKTIIIIR